MRFGVFGIVGAAAGVAAIPATYHVRELNGGPPSITLRAIRSDGARISASLPRPKFAFRTLWLPALRQEIHAWDDLRLVSTHYQPEPKAKKELSSCGHKADRGSTLVGSGTVAGLTAFRYRSEDYEYWFTPELDCREVKMVAGSESVREVIFVKKGEPDQELFAVPGDFREVAPSEALKETIRRTQGRSLDPANFTDQSMLKALEQMDKRYFASQQYKP